MLQHPEQVAVKLTKIPGIMKGPNVCPFIKPEEEEKQGSFLYKCSVYNSSTMILKIQNSLQSEERFK